MHDIESEIINFLGCHEDLIVTDNSVFWIILNSYDQNVGYLEYDELSGFYHLRINVPEIWLDTKRHKDSNEIECDYSIGKNKGKVRILRNN